MTQNPEFRANVPVSLDAIPLRRKGAPEEVGKLIAFLLSDEASYVTGSVYNIDAGLLC
jgi:NAD(P)-dependent dehydrogenase (short-subunit alcohol dehydrogenase family)